MRPLACCFALLFACASPTRPPSQPGQTDIPAHTQALIDAYRQVTSLPRSVTAATLSAMNDCPSAESELQKRERYLRSIGGCLEEPTPPARAELEPATPDEAAPLVAAFEARAQAVSACASTARLSWWPRVGAVANRFEIDAHGTITAIMPLPGQEGHDEVGCCVRRALRQAKLPAPGRALSLVYVANHKEAVATESAQLPGLSKEQIRQTISQHLDEVRACYEAGMADGSRFEGRLEVEFAVAPEGSTPLARVIASTIPSVSVACCLTAAIRSWSFPNPRREVVIVSYPFVLGLSR